MNITGIHGSPRSNGNSAALLDAALAGAAAAGGAVQRLRAAELNFVPCQNCRYCARTGVCRIQDEMARIYEAVDTADVVLLAAPIYFCSLPAQTKAMIDRCQSYWSRKYELDEPPVKAGRAGGFLCCCGFKDDRFLACTEQIVKTWFYILGIDYAGVLFFPRLDKPGDAAKHPTALDDARGYGRRLVEQWQAARSKE
jgi:multimeric flavodoxin WrbA